MSKKNSRQARSELLHSVPDQEKQRPDRNREAAHHGRVEHVHMALGFRQGAAGERIFDASEDRAAVAILVPAVRMIRSGAIPADGPGGTIQRLKADAAFARA
jgi:hypothetical protein